MQQRAVTQGPHTTVRVLYGCTIRPVVNRCKGLHVCTPRPQPFSMAITCEWQGLLLLFIQQCIHQSRPLCWETAGNGVQHKKPSSLLSVQPLLPHASKHGLCEASSLYSSSNQHRIPSPLETHPSKSKQLSSRFPPSTPPSDITAHTMPNTPRHSRLAGRQPPAFIEIRPIQLSNGVRTDMTLEFTNCCFTISRCS